jgi:transcriptional regulator with XRE-family HTH domain
MTLKDSVRRLREGKGWTQNHLARVAGVPQPTIWRLERGFIQNPKTNILQRLAEALDVSTDYLLREEGEDASFDEMLRHDPVGQAIFRNYEVLSSRGREQASSFVSWLVEQEKKEQEQV